MKFRTKGFWGDGLVTVANAKITSCHHKKNPGKRAETVCKSISTAMDGLISLHIFILFIQQHRNVVLAVAVY